jgi:hypothetical protein
MPGFDGTGPNGAGPATGKGMGPCRGYYNGGYGRRARLGLGSFWSPKNQKTALDAEKEALEAELEFVKEELTSLKNSTNK